MKNKMIKIAVEYNKIISAFMKQADVQNGKLVSYHDNQDPFGNLRDENWFNVGDAKITTGFCVSFSQAILTNELFRMFLEQRGALAKIVSIDIKEQFYGYCKPSYVQNKWHSAILVKDSNILFIIDPTCAQFGNAYVGKLIWDLETWEKTFRSPKDKHSRIGFGEENITYIPDIVNDKIYDYESKIVDLVNNMHNVTTIIDKERELIADFLLKGCNLMNRKLQLNNLSDADFNYMDIVNNILKNFNFKLDSQKEYFVMKFETSEALKSWILNLSNKNYILPIYIMMAKTLEQACVNNGIIFSDINKESTKDEVYLVIQINSVSGINLENIMDNYSTIIPYGIQLTDAKIYNYGKLLDNTSYGIEKKTNTVYIECVI